jgi:hypothetical protein
MADPMLFDPAHASGDLRPRRPTEDRYEYVSESRRPEIARARALLDAWFSEYPADAQASLAARFRGGEFIPAFFELYVFTLLRLQGYRPVVLEPAPHRAARAAPDFAIELPDGRTCYVEATTVDADPQLTRNEAALAPFDEALRSVSSAYPFYFVVERRSEKPLAYRKLADRIELWLGSPDFIALRSAAVAAGETTVSCDFEHDGWEIEITAYVDGPLAERVKPGASPLLHSCRCVHFLDPPAQIAKALKKKAGRYTVDGPLAIAIGILGMGVDRDEVETALYGPEWCVEHHDGSTTKDRRKSGLWFTPDRRPKNRGVAAVLACCEADVHTIATTTPTLYHAPVATSPVAALLPGVSHASLDGVPVRYRPGNHGWQLFGIPEAWPRGVDHDE